MIDTTELVNYLKYRDGTLTIIYPLTKHGYIITSTQAIRLKDGKPAQKHSWPVHGLALFVKPTARSGNALVVADRLAIPLYNNTVLSMTSQFGTFAFDSGEIRNS